MLGIHPFVSVVTSAIVLGAIGYVVQLGLINRVVTRSVLVTLILTFGLELMMNNAMLVSFSAEEGKAIGLKLGDTVTVNVLGRNVTARIANFRQVEWENMGINFVMVFSPNTFTGAPHGWMATLTERSATTADDTRILNAVTRAFPAVTTVRACLARHFGPGPRM